MTISPRVFDHEAFAKAFRAYRELQGKSLRAVAKELGINFTTLGRIENAKYTGPQIIILLSAYADIDPTDFIVENTPWSDLPLWSGRTEE